ncbi:MAG: sigma-70 family RNA polymerase sigma factor [Clostridia bacterium]|nr:sigma-70 family RNA polymerase sigma factor [Clostridia bacterium]
MGHNACSSRSLRAAMGNQRPAERGGTETERLIARHHRLVWVTARRFFPRLSHDQDLLQCGLIGLWEATRSWSGEGEFATYASRSILNNMKDYLRAAYKAPPPVDRGGRERAESYEDRLIDRLDTVAGIKAAWPENSRERYILLALSAGVSKQSIAAALGVELHTVRRIAVKAMEGLRQGQNG